METKHHRKIWNFQVQVQNHLQKKKWKKNSPRLRGLWHLLMRLRSHMHLVSWCLVEPIERWWTYRITTIGGALLPCQLCALVDSPGGFPWESNLGLFVSNLRYNRKSHTVKPMENFLGVLGKSSPIWDPTGFICFSAALQKWSTWVVLGGSSQDL